MARSAKLIGAGLVLVVVTLVGGWWFAGGASSRGEPAGPPVEFAGSAGATVESVDVTPRQVAIIPPGTVVDETPPEDWSHLIIRSHTRVADESADKVSALFARLASMLFTAVAADVQADEDIAGSRRFRLDRVAAGTGVEIDGRWVIVSSHTQEELGAELGFMERTALGGGEGQMAEARCVARSRTMAVIDFHGIRLLDGKHQDVFTRYALLVQPKTGRLDTLVWQMLRIEGETEATPTEPLGPMVRLAPNAIDDCPLHVDPDHFVFGVPTKKAFATQGPPQGGPTLELPDELKPIAAMIRLTPEAARTLQHGLMDLLAGQPDLP